MVVGYKSELEARAAFRFITNFHTILLTEDKDNIMPYDVKSKEFVVTLFKLKEKFEEIGASNLSMKYDRIDIWKY